LAVGGREKKKNDADCRLFTGLRPPTASDRAFLGSGAKQFHLRGQAAIAGLIEGTGVAAGGRRIARYGVCGGGG